MRHLFGAALFAACLAAPVAAPAQGFDGYGPRRAPVQRIPDQGVPAQSLYDPFGPYAGRAPWSPAWEYDSGSDNDRFPERPRYQQSGGQQTGGPARNLLPDDGLHIVPR